MGRCPICPGTNRCVAGKGPLPCRILCLGEAPGQIEDQTGIPFVGKTGMELDQTYLRRAGLRREDVRVTNTVKCRPPQNRKPTDKEIRGCADHHLPGEIAECQPEIIVLMGSSACSLIPDINLEVEHGFPRQGELYGWEGWVVPMYHPASGLHDTGMMKPMLEDWERFGGWLRGEPLWREPTTILTWYTQKIGVELGLHRVVKTKAVDTESHTGQPFSVQVSPTPGEADFYLISKQQQVLDQMIGKVPCQPIRHLQLALDDCHLILHHAPADIPILEGLGIPVTDYSDTMQEAYHLALPQSLKALAYRLCSMKMKSFAETVGPASRDAAVEWMIKAMNLAEEKLQLVEYKQLKTKIKEIRKPSEVERALRRICRYTVQNPEYDPWEKIADENTKFSSKDWEWLETELGPMPQFGIANIPLEEAVQYGCADADATLRVSRKLAELRAKLDDVVPESDWDV